MDSTVFIKMAALLGAGICMGFGAIGPGIGEGFTAYKAVQGITRQPHATDGITRTMLIGMAVAETPGIFALFIAIILALTPLPAQSLLQAVGLLSAGLCMGVGALGPGIGGGLAAGMACEGVGRQPVKVSFITRTMLIGQAVSQSTTIYSLFIAILLIYVI